MKFQLGPFGRNFDAGEREVMFLTLVWMMSFTCRFGPNRMKFNAQPTAARFRASCLDRSRDAGVPGSSMNRRLNRAMLGLDAGHFPRQECPNE